MKTQLNYMQKTKQKKKNVKVVLSEADLQKLAHIGNKEAIIKLEKYWREEKDPEKKAFAEMALEECELFYYQPSNQKEEKDFELCVLINKYHKRISKVELEIAQLKARLDWHELEGEVHKNILEKNKTKAEKWKYNHLEDFVCFDRNRLTDLQEELAYSQAFIKVAKSMIVTSKYKAGIPERHLSHYDFGFSDDRPDEYNMYDDFERECDDACSTYRETELTPEMIDELPF